MDINTAEKRNKVKTTDKWMLAGELDRAFCKPGQLNSVTKNVLINDEVKLCKKVNTKRSQFELEESQYNKKAKMNTDTSEEGVINCDYEVDKNKLIKATKKSVKKQTKKLTRNELENILSVKMVEMINNKSEIGKLRQKCDSYDDIIEMWKNRAEALRKQCDELSIVMRKYIVDAKNKPIEKIRPMLITRNVGLQVMSKKQQRAQVGVNDEGGLIQKDPASLSSLSKPTNIDVFEAPSHRSVPKVEVLDGLNGFVKISSSPVKSTVKVVCPTVLTFQPRPNTNAGRTTITPSSPMSSDVPPVKPAPVTSQAVSPLAQSSSSQIKNPVINVVEIDLSDDEEKGEPAPQQQRPMPTLQRAVGTGIVRQGGPQLALISTKDYLEKLWQSRASPGSSGFGQASSCSRSSASSFSPGLCRPSQKTESTTQSTGVVPLQPQQQNPLMMFQGRILPMIWTPRLSVPRPMTHPAPLPDVPKYQPSNPDWITPPRAAPPRPTLKISRNSNGITLWWNISINLSSWDSIATIASYELFAYQESNLQFPNPNLWKKVGDFKALPLPMACKLSPFTLGNKFHFAIRGVDVHKRVGSFSEPSSIFLN